MTPQRKSSLRFVTWNTCGIQNTGKSPEKFSDLLKTLNDLKADIVFLQETHIGPMCYKILEDKALIDWKVYFTVYRPRSKGVAILIKKELLDSSVFEYICHDEDCNGGYIVLFCHLYGELYTLVNVYNHKADKEFLLRMKDYLLETAEGVLVVGGDFNTVLHPNFDRSPSSAWHSQFRAILEDFTASLNLRDTWAYKHSTEKVFTRRQKIRNVRESRSRLDMFFLRETELIHVCHISVKQQVISDHNPLVLDLKIQIQTDHMNKQIPSVASQLKEFKYIPDRRSGKISGAEILSVIKSLTEKCIPGMRNVKGNRCPLTETLKKTYNSMIKNRELDKLSKTQNLILCKILAKRLKAFITPSFKGKTATTLDKLITVTLKKGSQKINLSYLKTKLDDLKSKRIHSAPPVEFSILESLLPKVQNSPGEFRFLLRPGFPLTNTILNLALKDLERMAYRPKWKCEEAGHLRGKHHKPKCREIRSMASVCYQRQVLLIHAQSNVSEDMSEQVDNFREISGLEIDITKT